MLRINGIKDPAFRDAVALTRPAERAASGRYLVEGVGMVQQALRSPSLVHAVFALDDELPQLRAACATAGVPCYAITPGLIAKLVGTSYDTAVTAIAVVGQHLIDAPAITLTPDTLILACERIQDPRNVGVLIRTAEAAGCAALLLSTDCAEPFTRAAVRSTTGSILRLPLCICHDLPATLGGLKARGATILATSARAPQLIYDQGLGHQPVVVTVGNETEGISDQLRAVATAFVALPMAPAGASSLNVTVAAGIMLYETVRCRLPER